MTQTVAEGDFFMQTEQQTEVLLAKICEKEEIAEKKLNIYARLLMDPALAQAMEKMAKRHTQRLELLGKEQGKKPTKKEGGAQE